MQIKWWFFFYHTATVTDTDIYHIKDLATKPETFTAMVEDVARDARGIDSRR